MNPRGENIMHPETSIVLQITSIPRRFRSVMTGDRVIVNLRGGGTVKGTAARHLIGALVIAQDEKGADVIVLERSSYGAAIVTEQVQA